MNLHENQRPIGRRRLAFRLPWPPPGSETVSAAPRVEVPRAPRTLVAELSRPRRRETMKDSASAGDGDVTRRNMEHSCRREEFAAHVAAMLAITRVHFALSVSPEGSLPLPVAVTPRK